MKKLFIITGFILLSSAAATAQTDYTKRNDTDAPVISSRTEASAKRRQTDRVVDGRVVRVGPTTTYLKNGLSKEEVVRLLGKPASVSERLEGGRILATYTFPRSEGRVLVAQFENGILIDSRMEAVQALRR
ncbi:MAG TPA: hypothetical protein VJS44_09525 [Pyrinomonadaceae bacterium]|nr:hypothetical protein [Pyrinomonadaceae bacterium]